MKHYRRILIPLLFLSSFSFLPSCQGEKYPAYESDKILLHKAEGIQSLVNLSTVEELNSVCRYDDAMVFVYLVGCSHCEEQSVYLNQYIQNTESVIYAVDYYVYLQAYDSEDNQSGSYVNLYPACHATPMYLFYSEGTLKNAISTGIDANSYEEYVQGFSSKVLEIPLYQLNDFTYNSEDGYTYFTTSEAEEDTKSLDTLGYTTDNLDALLASGEKATVLYTWRRCTDCKSYRSYVFNEFITSTDKAIYFYEIDGYYLLKRQSDETLRNLGLEKWATFSSKYHLYTEDYYNSDVLGNKAGVAPTIVTYDQGEYSSMDVYLNEMNPTRNEDGTLSYSMAFHSEAKEAKSDTTVEENYDVTDDSYIQAQNELADKVLDIDIRLGKEYLQNL